MRFSPKHLQLYLSRALRRNRLGHAILFVADSASDKEYFFRLFAKLLLCEHAHHDADLITPCEDCRDCKQVSESAHPSLDLIVPSKSNEIRIDQIRELRDSLRLSSFDNRPRLIVLEDATLLTNQAANALLKSLEEPNLNQYFILMTTSSMAIPKTLISRCQRIITSSISQPEQISPDNNNMENFAAKIVERIQNADLKERLSLIEEISKSAFDKQTLLTQIQMNLHKKLRSKTSLHCSSHADALRSIESTEDARALLKSNVNLQLTLENWLLKSWPIQE